MLSNDAKREFDATTRRNHKNDLKRGIKYTGDKYFLTPHIIRAQFVFLKLKMREYMVYHHQLSVIIMNENK